MTVDTYLSLRDRAKLAYLDRQDSEEDYLVDVAREFALEALGSGADIEDIHIDTSKNMITFTVEDLSFRARLSTVTRSGTSNAGVEGIHQEEVRELQVNWKGSWIKVKELADLGALIDQDPPNVITGSN